MLLAPAMADGLTDEANSAPKKRPSRGLLSRRRGPKPGTPKPEGSGRKKGTPNRVTRDIRAIAAKHSPKAIRVLVKALADTDPKVSLLAARELLDRAHGKPMQATEVSGPNGVPLNAEPMSDFDRARHILFILAKAQAALGESVKSQRRAPDTKREEIEAAQAACPPPASEPEPPVADEPDARTERWQAHYSAAEQGFGSEPRKVLRFKPREGTA